MKKGTTFSLEAAVSIVGIISLSLCIFYFPGLAQETADRFPEFSGLQYPVLIGVYATAIPFYFALYQALKLLNCIDRNKAFSEEAVKTLKHIKYCAISISVLYAFGSLLLFFENALHPGVVIIVATVIFASVVIALFSAVLQMLLKNALDIKSENDLTV
ncbi:DUF2975 domain-containing protein [Mesobacillus zeae]|uniref:DUF2975 domain-containing protein n=1 Tax=Mesobacillus zeae TaxID=1917180 RepID=A0A398BAZ9_9BACI|nr:DUF2975 domain-containing protein [Mesobacillus zeae]RID86734.1 DUF2975 domain-containing protein [Mesobacillus zeae]